MAESRDPGGKFTVFDLLTLGGAVAGAVVGAKLGHAFKGLPTALIFGAVGLFLGSLPGRLIGNHGVMSLFRELNAMDSHALRLRMEKQYFVSHLAVLILLKRGEPAGPLLDWTLQELLSENQDRRHHAWRTLGLNFPDAAEKLKGIDVMGSPEVYRETVEGMRIEKRS